MEHNLFIHTDIQMFTLWIPLTVLTLSIQSANMQTIVNNISKSYREERVFNLAIQRLVVGWYVQIHSKFKFAALYEMTIGWQYKQAEAHTCTYSWPLCITNIWRAFAHRGICWLIGSRTLVATNQCYITLITKKLFLHSIHGLCQCPFQGIDSSSAIMQYMPQCVSCWLCNLVTGRFITCLRITSSFASEKT